MTKFNFHDKIEKLSERGIVMDITLIRQGLCQTETENGKTFEFLPSNHITDISKSSLRLAYACGERPLFVNKGGEDWEISVEEHPQARPDVILCGENSNSLKSAHILRRQLHRLGFKVPVIKLKSLSESALSEEYLTRFHTKLIQNSFNSLEKRGLKHIIVMANQKELNAIFTALTGKKSHQNPEVSMRIIQDGKLSYSFNPADPNYITEGMYETMLFHHINGEHCPKHLKKFKGKIKGLLGDTYLSQKFRTELKR